MANLGRKHYRVVKRKMTENKPKNTESVQVEQVEQIEKKRKAFRVPLIFLVLAFIFGILDGFFIGFRIASKIDRSLDE